MSTLSAPSVKPADPESKEKKIYSLIESFAEYIPIANDRNRLAYTLVTNDNADPVAVTVKNNKLHLEGITVEELSIKIERALSTQ